jgi:transposase
VRRRLGRRILLVWDRWNVHRSAPRQRLEGGTGGVPVEWLPAYAPELNPAEHLRNHAKYTDSADFLPDDVWYLGGAVVESLDEMSRRPNLLGCIPFPVARLIFSRHTALNPRAGTRCSANNGVLDARVVAAHWRRRRAGVFATFFGMHPTCCDRWFMRRNSNCRVFH